MMSLDSGDQQVSVVPPTPAADKQSVEMVEVDTSSDNEQWLELVNKPLIPEAVKFSSHQQCLCQRRPAFQCRSTTCIDNFQTFPVKLLSHFGAMLRAKHNGLVLTQYLELDLISAGLSTKQRPQVSNPPQWFTKEWVTIERKAAIKKMRLLIKLWEEEALRQQCGCIQVMTDRVKTFCTVTNKETQEELLDELVREEAIAPKTDGKTRKSHPSFLAGNQDTVVTQLQRSVSDVVRDLEANKKRDNREGRRQLYHHPRWNGPRPDPRGKREDDSLPSTSRDTRREEHEGDLLDNAHSPITLCNNGERGIPPMKKIQRPWQRKMQSLSKFAEPEVDGFLDVLNTSDG
eukprot:Em0028g52a